MAEVRLAIGAGAALSVALLSYFFLLNRRRNNSCSSSNRRRRGIVEAIGNTPLIRINSLSDATGCEILGKAEFLNPGGGIKDRVAVKIIQEAIESGELIEGGIITEGSAGSTAISLATVAPAFNVNCHVIIPDDAAIEKSQIIEALGAKVERVRPVSITHKDHFVNIAKRRALEAKLEAKTNKEVKGGYFADQFENLANFRAHYEGTGPEIWTQTKGKLNAFICAAGTGGTIAGISKFLKDKKKNIKCYLMDPPGSGLYNRVTRGVMYTKQEAEGKRLKYPFDTVTEGIGINRITSNFSMVDGLLDGGIRGTDREAIEMSRYLLREDGLFLGSSSAMNCVGAVKLARELGHGNIIVTILCDSGIRHLSKFYNDDYLNGLGLCPKAKGLEFLD